MLEVWLWAQGSWQKISEVTCPVQSVKYEYIQALSKEKHKTKEAKTNIYNFLKLCS